MEPRFSPSLPNHLRTHAFHLARYVKGWGVEIGAHDNPIPGLAPLYIDRVPELEGRRCQVDRLGRADALPLRDHSVDYVASSHVLEHVANPLRALREWCRVLRHRGLIYFVVPDCRHTWERHRSPTDARHFITDFAAEVDEHDATHIEEFVGGIDWPACFPHHSPDQLLQEREGMLRQLRTTAARGETIDIHFHAFDPSTVRGLFDAFAQLPACRSRLELLTVQDHFPASCPNGILAIARVHHLDFPARLLGWRHRRLTRTHPSFPLLPTSPVTTLPTTMPDPSSPPAAASLPPSGALDDVVRREAFFRLATLRTFRELERTITEQSLKIDALNDELGARNTYIHDLHARREDFVRAVQAAHADLEHFARHLATAEDERAAARAEITRIKSAPGWWVFKKLIPPPPAATPAVALARSLAFTYHLPVSPFRLYREPTFTLRGWAFPVDGRAVTAIRARLGDREFIGRAGLDEPEVAQTHDLAATANPRPGFEVTFATPAGRHELRLEAQLENRDWFEILATPIWSTAP